MNENELKEFINFFTHNKTLSRSQKSRRDKLLARDIVGEKEAQSVPRKKEAKTLESLSPLSTASFFSQFNDPMALKYLTHDFDANDDERPHTMTTLIKQVNEVVGKKEIKIPESLWALLNGFISNGKWFDTYEQVHSSTFIDKRWATWSETNNMHPICNPDFRNEIMAFRSTIRVVPPALQEIVEMLKAKTSLNITTEKLAKADFYTNTYILYKVIKRILSMMDKRVERFPDVSIAYTRSQDPDGRMLRHIVITQKGSYAIKPISEIKSRMDRNAEAGDFGAIRKMLNGYCYWSVTTVWDDKPYRWNILKNNEVDDIEPINGNVDGFTHELTFYIV